jgi:hypothetical protein
MSEVSVVSCNSVSMPLPILIPPAASHPIARLCISLIVTASLNKKHRNLCHSVQASLLNVLVCFLTNLYCFMHLSLYNENMRKFVSSLIVWQRPGKTVQQEFCIHLYLYADAGSHTLTAAKDKISSLSVPIIRVGCNDFLRCSLTHGSWVTHEYTLFRIYITIGRARCLPLASPRSLWFWERRFSSCSIIRFGELAKQKKQRKEAASLTILQTVHEKSKQ